MITVRHLLSHSEGFPEDNPWGDRQLAETDATLSRWMRAGFPFSQAPGVGYEYSNTGFATTTVTSAGWPTLWPRLTVLEDTQRPGAIPPFENIAGRAKRMLPRS